MLYSKLDWMEIENDGYYRKVELINEDAEVTGKIAEKRIDLIIGTDVVYWRSSIAPLVSTLNTFFNS